jgi:6,7-dimethyl-8-ribityllumazine synthase
MNNKIHVLTTIIHEDLTSKMVGYAQEYAQDINLEIYKVIKVPGTLEFPFFVNELILKEQINGLLILGILEKGETNHGEVIAHQVTKTLLDLQIKYRIPMSIAIIGPNSTIEHAEEKSQRTTEKAMRVLLSMMEFKKNNHPRIA